MTRPSNATYVYHLRHGVKFWDGTELTSEDVATSLNYERYPTALSAAYYASVKSIKATDRYTVVITLKHPDAGFQFVVASSKSGIFEAKFFNEHKTTFGHPGTLVMASGPWMPVSFDPTSGFEAVANPHWWGGKVNIQHISVKFFSSETSEALAMRAGEIDVVFPFLTQAFASTSGQTVLNFPSGSTLGTIAMDSHVPPWNDIHIRRAVAYAINRADIIKATGNAALPTSTLIPPQQLRLLGSQSQVNTLLKSMPTYSYNLAKAKQEMALSSESHGFSANFDTINFGAYPTVAQAIAGQLDQIGIKLKVNVTPAWGTEVYQNPRPGINFYSFSNANPDAGTYPGIFLGSKNAREGQNNFAEYAPPVMDNLLVAALSTSNPSKRLTLYGQVLKRLATDLPYVPLYTQNSAVAVSGKFAWPSADSLTYFRPTWPLRVKLR